MTMGKRRTLTVRVDEDDYLFLNRFAVMEKEDVSKAVRDLVGKGRVLVAVERYRSGRASLGKAAAVAGVSMPEMMDLLASYGVQANLSVEDYQEGLRHLADEW